MLSNLLYQIRSLDSMKSYFLIGNLGHANLIILKKFRDRAFVDIIRHAYKHVPYYQNMMNENGIRPDSVRGIDDLSRFPILTKDTIREQGNRLLAQNIPLSRVYRMSTGGTTGGALTINTDRWSHSLAQAAFHRGMAWMGYSPHLTVMNLAGGSLGECPPPGIKIRFKQFLLGQFFIPAFELDPETVRKYVLRIQRIGPCVLIGYASALHQLSLLCQDRGLNIDNVRLVLSTAETLPQDWKLKIASFFGCPVKCFYGSVEQNSIGFQTEEDGAYIVSDEILIIENPTKTSRAESSSPPLLLTSLFNKAQPLIRYDLGDCGVVFPLGTLHPSRTVIKSLEGRVEDQFVRKGGSRVSGAFVPHLVQVGRLPIGRYQLIQWDYAEFEFRYELRPNHLLHDGHRDALIRILQKHVDKSARVEFKETTQFILSPQKKHRVSICKVRGLNS